VVFAMKTFSETQPPAPAQETDRFPLVTGIFIITGYVLVPSSKYKDGVARINGYDPKTKAVRKYWYTGKAVIHQLENMKKSVGMDGPVFKEEIKTEVVEVKAEKGKYLSLADPA
jgi:hypothetical protein